MARNKNQHDSVTSHTEPNPQTRARYQTHHSVQLEALVGNSNTEIPDDIIIEALNLMKSSSDPAIQPYIGYFLPAEITFAISTYHQNTASVIKSPLPDGVFSINIHPLPGHWVTSCYYPSTGSVHVYDSLMTQDHLDQVIPQLRVVYGEHKLNNVQYEHVTQQGIQPLCGVMAIAFAFSTFHRKDPCSVNYDISLAREHLRHCISHSIVLQFPEKQTSSNTHQYNFKNSVSDRIMQSSLETYFSDQQIKTAKHKLMKKSTEQVHSTQNQSEKISLQKDRTHHQKVYRAALSTTQKEILKLKDRVRKQIKRSSLTDCESEKLKMNDNKRKKSYMNSLSVSEKEIIKASDNKRKKSYMNSLSVSEKEDVKANHNKRNKSYRNSLSESKKEIIKASDNKRKKSYKNSLSDSKKEKLKKNDKKRKISYRNSLSHSQKEKNKSKDKTRRHFSRNCINNSEKAIAEFEKAASKGPIYVCASCLRLLYRQSVIQFKDGKYGSSRKLLSTQHQCFDNIWICSTCDKYLSKNQIPPQNFTNNLEVDTVPDEIKGLSSLESHLISQRIPFMKIMSRPRGGQKAISGAVVNVPINSFDTCTNLPRPPPNSSFIMLKLKRKQEYKSSVIDQVIRPKAVISTLRCLMNINPLYCDVQENDNAFDTTLLDGDQEMWKEIFSVEDSVNKSQDINNSQGIHSAEQRNNTYQNETGDKQSRDNVSGQEGIIQRDACQDEVHKESTNLQHDKCVSQTGNENHSQHNESQMELGNVECLQQTEQEN